VFASMSVLENLTTAAYLRHRGARAARRHAEEVAERVELGPVVGSPAAGLTAAWRKRLEMGRASLRGHAAERHRGRRNGAHAWRQRDTARGARLV
jgi:ABC-type branched-subunit amino acid transport system ATPase component